MPRVTLTGAKGTPLNRRPRAVVRVGGQTYRFRHNHTEEVPQAVADHVKKHPRLEFSVETNTKTQGASNG